MEATSIYVAFYTRGGQARNSALFGRPSAHGLFGAANEGTGRVSADGAGYIGWLGGFVSEMLQERISDFL
jgi:hypothetical protein